MQVVLLVLFISPAILCFTHYESAGSIGNDEATTSPLLRRGRTPRKLKSVPPDGRRSDKNKLSELRRTNSLPTRENPLITKAGVAEANARQARDDHNRTWMEAHHYINHLQYAYNQYTNQPQFDPAMAYALSKPIPSLYRSVVPATKRLTQAYDDASKAASNAQLLHRATRNSIKATSSQMTGSSGKDLAQLLRHKYDAELLPSVADMLEIQGGRNGHSEALRSVAVSSQAMWMQESEPLLWKTTYNSALRRNGGRDTDSESEHSSGER